MRRLTEHRAGPFIKYAEDIRTKKIHGNAERITAEWNDALSCIESAAPIAFEYNPRGYALVKLEGNTYKIHTCKSRLGNSLREFIALSDEEMEAFRVKQECLKGVG